MRQSDDRGGEATVVLPLELDCLLRVFLRSTLTGVARAIGAEQWSMSLYDCRSAELVLEYAQGREGVCPGVRRGAGAGIEGEALRTRGPVLIEDIRNDVRFAVSDHGRYRTGSCICAPLYVAQEMCGVFNFSDKAGCSGFGEQDFRFVVSAMKYACMIVEDWFALARQRRENALLRKESALAEKFAAIGAMAAGLLARIKEPLAPLKIRAAEVRAVCSSAKSQSYAGQIKTGLERIERLSSPLLETLPDFSYGGACVLVNQLLDEALLALAPRFEKDIRIVRRYGDDLPGIPVPALGHVFMNIIKNAIEAMPAGGELEISTARDGRGIRIDFSDTGTGIPHDNCERIFEPFFTTKKRTGAGLGLAICKEIVGTCGGVIEVHSLPGKGSRFSISIPVPGAASGKF